MSVTYGDLEEMFPERLTIPLIDFVPQFGRNITVDKPTIASVNGVEYPLSEAFHLAETLWEPVYLSAGAQESMQAFKELRPPAWKGM